MLLCVYTKNNKEVYPGIVKPISAQDVTTIAKQGWFFEWEKEYGHPLRHVYKLLIKGTNDIEGLVSFEYEDGFVLVEYLEAAPHNLKEDGLKVGAPLIAFACKQSFDIGFQGYVLISIKWNERMIRYYEDLGAKVFGVGRMGFHPVDSMELLKVYLYKGE
ncbi:hypothetical protein LGQ02_19445 [Bacillus shivajii]|uniref:hypothetical protein n=1 Tax=Bacillus shivajii TaxID=1983719 RepID=UPI001CFBEB32|nr:hypothetical protein [Bacillus shivajii]UCZ52929.1 hypothetical protein LGQ02_19445 [Bacillus shivajii]